MATLQEVMQTIDRLTHAERAALRAYLDQQDATQAGLDAEQLSTEEWIRRMEAAAAAIREDFSAEEWAAVEQAMNAEFIQPWDASEWLD
jgi:predicted  nucleic acid-binding Zn-ribbon protein